jgi:hypothetical protein
MLKRDAPPAAPSVSRISHSGQICESQLGDCNLMCYAIDFDTRWYHKTAGEKGISGGNPANKKRFGTASVR